MHLCSLTLFTAFDNKITSSILAGKVIAIEKRLECIYQSKFLNMILIK